VCGGTAPKTAAEYAAEETQSSKSGEVITKTLLNAAAGD
jgi:hypothetical protein